MSNGRCDICGAPAAYRVKMVENGFRKVKELCEEKARELARQAGREDEYNLYESIEKLAPKAFYRYKGSNTKTIAANVDFYSGFIYQCLGIPEELFTPIFAIARVAGWAAHRIEEVTSSSARIIRPAYKSVVDQRDYVPISER